MDRKTAYKLAKEILKGTRSVNEIPRGSLSINFMNFFVKQRRMDLVREYCNVLKKYY